MRLLAAARAAGRPAIVVGGTGFYLHALLRGIPAMPEIPPQLRSELRAWTATRSAADVHAHLASHDPTMAARLQPGDRQRAFRALEVYLASGRSLLEWQSAKPQRLALPDRVVGMALVPAAEVVAPRIQTRLEAMLGEGALREVSDLLARVPDALTLPIAKVHKALAGYGARSHYRWDSHDGGKPKNFEKLIAAKLKVAPREILPTPKAATPAKGKAK